MDDPRTTSSDAREAPDSKRIPGGVASYSYQQVYEAITRIAQGDLNFRINGYQAEGAPEDRQLLLNLDGLARRLRYIVGRLQRAADSIDAVVGEVLRGTQLLSAGVLDEAK
jgi:methyl-accepting chemotaxis protein